MLLNSFPGLDHAMTLPPNFVMTGPLSLPQDDLGEKLATKDSELKAWLDEAKEKGEKVVYISLGSICKWQ